MNKWTQSIYTKRHHGIILVRYQWIRRCALYYGILTVCVIMFSVQFLFNDKYANLCGSTIEATFVFSVYSSIAGLLCLLVINRFRIHSTPFTLCLAFLTAINSILFTLCSLKALSRIRMSLFSLYSMLGGMILPFVAGLLFYQEALSVGKILCIVLLIGSLLLTLEKEKYNGGLLYCLGAFVFNGMSGVLSKIFESASYDKASSANYSIWIAVATALISVVILLILGKRSLKIPIKSLVYPLGYGAVNRIANYLLLIALTALPASVQYPFITGGVIAVSAVISAIAGQSPTKREVLAVILAFIGICFLITI